MPKNKLDEMTILIAPDSFKECLSAHEVCSFIEEGILRVSPHIKCIKHPMADGGEGTLEAMVLSTNGRTIETEVLDPLGRPIRASFGLLGECEETAIIEMARASGLERLTKEERNPLVTTSYGTGQLIKAAMDQGVKTILIGIGGTATNDGGVGALQALGAKFIGEAGQEVGFGGGQIGNIHKIDLTQLDKRIKTTTFIGACDVTNPLLGAQGASVVFSPQKGATEEMVHALEENMQVLSHRLGEMGFEGLELCPGSGAAGGMGYAILTLLGGRLERGVELVMDYSKLNEHILEADLVITGEGKIDTQTKFGKVPFGVGKRCKSLNKPVIALAGQVAFDDSLLNETYLDACFSIQQRVSSLEEAFSLAPESLRQTSEQLIRLISQSFLLEKR